MVVLQLEVSFNNRTSPHHSSNSRLLEPDLGLVVVVYLVLEVCVITSG